jgi:hypothetical protein
VLAEAAALSAVPSSAISFFFAAIALAFFGAGAFLGAAAGVAAFLALVWRHVRTFLQSATWPLTASGFFAAAMGPAGLVVLGFLASGSLWEAPEAFLLAEGADFAGGAFVAVAALGGMLTAGIRPNRAVSCRVTFLVVEGDAFEREAVE